MHRPLKLLDQWLYRIIIIGPHIKVIPLCHLQLRIADIPASVIEDLNPAVRRDPSSGGMDLTGNNLYLKPRLFARYANPEANR